MNGDSFNNQELKKLPPQSIEAEKSALGALMLDKNAIIKVADFLQSKDFYKRNHQEIYRAILELFSKGEPVDLLAVSTRLKEKKLLEGVGGNSYLTELINQVPTASHVSHYAQIVQRKRILRDLIEASQEINSLGYNEEENIDIILDKAEQRIFSIAQKSLTQQFLLVKNTLEEAFERIDKLSKQKGILRGLPTGFTDLDNILAGLQKSDLVILASRPSLGKSSLALNFASNIAINQKEPVGLFSLEMSKDQVVDRLIATLSNVDLWRLRTGRLSAEGNDNDFTRIQQAMGILSEAPIYIDDTATSNVLQMRAMARRLQAEHGLGLIIIDYLQLMEPRETAMPMVQQVTEISRSLKGLARELDVPVLALSQLSRAVEQRSPQIPRLADLRESGCLTGDTLITRADTGERIPMRELVNQKNIPVFTLGHDYKLHVRKMVEIFYSGKKMVYEMKTRNGRKIKASANHPFWTIDGWKRLDELNIGDYIALPRALQHQSPQNVLPDEELILLAHLLGDGCVLPNQPVHYTSADWENINIVVKTAKKIFKIKPRIVKQENWWHVYLPSPYSTARGKYHPITNWYKKLGIERVRSWNKKIPEAVFQCSQEKIALFLKHLWATDGNLSWKFFPNAKPAGNIYYATSSRILAEQVQHLLLVLGIQSTLREALSRKGYRMMYHLYIMESSKEQLKFLKKIGIAGERKKIVPQMIKQLEKILSVPRVDVLPKKLWQYINQVRILQNLSWDKFSERCNISGGCASTRFKSAVSYDRLQKIALHIADPYLTNLVNSDIFWNKIVSIKKLCVEDVYDATVEDFHNFVANDIIVENSLEQDADVVMFIYREDRYRSDTTRKNIADIIIAKHRNGPVGKVELYFDDRRVCFRNLEKEEYQE